MLRLLNTVKTTTDTKKAYRLTETIRFLFLTCPLNKGYSGKKGINCCHYPESDSLLHHINAAGYCADTYSIYVISVLIITSRTGFVNDLLHLIYCILIQVFMSLILFRLPRRDIADYFFIFSILTFLKHFPKKTQTNLLYNTDIQYRKDDIYG